MILYVLIFCVFKFEYQTWERFWFPAKHWSNPLIQQRRGHNISLYSRVVFPRCFLMCVLLFFLFRSPVHLQKKRGGKKNAEKVGLNLSRFDCKSHGYRWSALAGDWCHPFALCVPWRLFFRFPGLSDSIHLDVFGGFFLSENPHFPNKCGPWRFLVGEVLTTWNYSEKMASQKERIIFEPSKLYRRNMFTQQIFRFYGLMVEICQRLEPWALRCLFVFLEQWDVKPQFSGVWFLPSDLVFDVSFRWKTFTNMTLDLVSTAL